MRLHNRLVCVWPWRDTLSWSTVSRLDNPLLFAKFNSKISSATLTTLSQDTSCFLWVIRPWRWNLTRCYLLWVLFKLLVDCKWFRFAQITEWALCPVRCVHIRRIDRSRSRLESCSLDIPSYANFPATRLLACLSSWSALWLRIRVSKVDISAFIGREWHLIINHHRWSSHLWTTHVDMIIHVLKRLDSLLDLTFERL